MAKLSQPSCCQHLPIATFLGEARAHLPLALLPIPESGKQCVGPARERGEGKREGQGLRSVAEAGAGACRGLCACLGAAGAVEEKPEVGHG